MHAVLSTYQKRVRHSAQTTASGLLRLKHFFAAERVPEKRVDGNLVLGTWNLREFGVEKYGDRDKEALYYIAEIISRFDLIAVQQLRAEMGDCTL